MIRPQKGMFAFEIFEKNAVCLFIRKQYLAIFGYFQKIGFTLTCHHYRNTFLAWAPGKDHNSPQTPKKSLILALRGKCLSENCIFSKFEQI